MPTLGDRRSAMQRCTKCHSCKQSPELQSHAHSAICPSQDFGVFYAYTAAGKQAAAYALDEGRIGYSDAFRRNVYACSMCGACQSACTWNHEGVDPLDTLHALREKFAADGQSPPEHLAMLESLERHGNPYGRPGAERMAWAKGLGVADARRGAARRVLVHVGAALAYRAPAEARAIVRLLQAAGVDFVLMLDDEPEFGAAAFDLGYPALARSLGERALARLAAAAPAQIVVCGADTIAAIRNTHPRLGLQPLAAPTLHITEYLASLAEAGRLSFPRPTGRRVAYHDPCELGRLSEAHVPWNGQVQIVLNVVEMRVPPKPLPTGSGGIYDAPRRLLTRAGFELVEFERRRELAYCCGAGGGACEVHPAFGEKAARSRHSEAQSIGASAITTACGSCLSHLGHHGTASLPTEGLFSLLAATLAAQGE